MNGTPRLRSAFPASPVKYQPRRPEVKDGPRSTAAEDTGDAGPSVIAEDIIDHGTQRIYVFAVYGLLSAWRLYDCYCLAVADEPLSPLWSFSKFAVLDAIFIWGLPELRIPLLQWSTPTAILLYLLHLLLNALLCFNPSLFPQLSALFVSRSLFDRELALAERSVNPAQVLNNASLLLGKQTIHILPEGSVTLNPSNQRFCVGSSVPQVELPISFNQTTPIALELLRHSLDGGDDEIIRFTQKQIKSSLKHPELVSRTDSKVRQYGFVVKKPGLYQILRITESKDLLVRHEKREALVVSCPEASLELESHTRCRGELSNVRLHVTGVPPFRVQYSKNVGGKKAGLSIENVQPEGFALTSLQDSSNRQDLVSTGEFDVRLAQSQHLSVPINETLNTGGEWSYIIEEIGDGWGNIIKYNQKPVPRRTSKPKSRQVHQAFQVYERPRIGMKGCSPQQPLTLAAGQQVAFPVELSSTSAAVLEIPHHIRYTFTPSNDLEQADDLKVSAPVTYRMNTPQDKPKIGESGLYRLTAVRTDFCTGEVIEPSGCLLTHPPKPQLKLRTEILTDSCAGNPIGLLIDFSLIGTPPFTIHYEERDHHLNRVQRQSVRVPQGLRYQLRLEPKKAGEFSYRFYQIDDAVYDRVVLDDTGNTLSQTVKPPAAAYIWAEGLPSSFCRGERARIPVSLHGEAPWTLNYDIIHADHRSSHTLENIESDSTVIITDELTHGGDYVIGLSSVQDRSGCKNFLSQQAKIAVRYQSPTAAFGHFQGAYRRLTVANQPAELPIRLSGQGPWTLSYNTPEDKVEQITLRKNNDNLLMTMPGQYEIISVRDSECPGVVEPSAEKFFLDWVPRPAVGVSVGKEDLARFGVHLLPEVCQGDESGVELLLEGSPPFSIAYETKNLQAAKSAVQKVVLRAGTHSTALRLDTRDSGRYEYRLTKIGDYNYDRIYSGLGLEQIVHARPKARFAKPHHIHQYCKDEQSQEEGLAVKLDGHPPFQLEVGLRYSSSSKPELVRFTGIESHDFQIRFSDRLLSVGQHSVTINKITDGRGCHSSVQGPDTTAKVVVGIAPTIVPDDRQHSICVGDRVSYSLTGSPPFQVEYVFNGISKKVEERSTTFRRLAERPGNLTVTSVSDNAQPGQKGAAGVCRSSTRYTTIIHSLPSVRISRGLDTVADIREGGEVDLEFTFEGQPPFEFTYIRSQDTQKGQKPKILETRHDTSNHHRKIVKASDEGVYEVIAIRDAHCAFSKHGGAKGTSQKMLGYGK